MTMIERIKDVLGNYPEDADPGEVARAVIGAMREPTEAMVHAGWLAGDDTAHHSVIPSWQAMIDAATPP